MKKVYCIGELLIDLVSIDGKSYDKKPGGAPANVAVTVSKLNGKGYFLGAVGNDSFGNFLEKVMMENKVNCEYLIKKGKTTLAIVTLDQSGERSFEFYRGSDGEYQLDSSMEINSDSIVHFGSATGFLDGELRESYYKLLEISKNNGALISFDPNYRDMLITKDFEKIFINHCEVFMKEADLIKISDEEAILLTGTRSLEEATENLMKRCYKAVIVITLGKEGTRVLEKGNVYTVPSIKVNQKDSTGAGDAFVGGVLYSLSKDENISYKEAVAFGNKVGAITCEGYGAIPSIPAMDVVLKRDK